LSGAIRLVFLGLDMGSYGLDQLVVDGGVLQVRSGSGALAESGREAGSGNRSGFAETLEVTMAADAISHSSNISLLGVNDQLF
jgi:hypothetical protein